MGKISINLSKRIFLGIAAILLAVSLMLFGILWFFLPRTYENDLSVQTKSDLMNLKEQLEMMPIEDWENVLKSPFQMININDLFMLDENGEPIAVFKEILDNLVVDDQADIQAVSPNIGNGVSFEKNGEYYTIGANVNYTQVDHLMLIFARISPFVLLFIIIISALAAFFYSRFLAKPIVDITNSSKRMASLDMTWRCDASRSDEIGTLAVNMNKMAEKLATTLNELQTANEKLKADIDKEREQDKRRRDFFSAISHELKTPVTILKGELDGMILNVGKFKDRDIYLQEAYETTESIEKLVREILTISKLDTLSLNIEDAQLSVLVDECCRMYEVMANDKRIHINRLYEEHIIIHADNKQIKTVISNIIGNAVKHSPENSIVDIKIQNTNGSSVLTVHNTGIHIDANELPQIWEPFYRTDKSRSRDTGGSGLGLYIVKTILDNHSFEYSFKNTDNGMKFTIIFPL